MISDIRLTAVAGSLVFGLSLAGCLGAPDHATCAPYPSDERQAVYDHVNRRWGEAGTENQSDNPEIIYVGVKAMRIPADQGTEDWSKEFIQWKEFDAAKRPAVVHDLLCLSEWRIQNVENLTHLPFWTTTATADTIGTGALTALEAEHERQNGHKPQRCCTIVFRDDLYIAGLMDVHNHGDG